MFSPTRYFPPTYFAPRMFGGVAGSVTPTPTPTPTGNHRYSFGALKTAAKQALGGAASANLDLGDVVNDALSWLCDYHEWSWLRRMLTLSLTSGQSYIVLPDDFKSLVSLKRAGSIFGDPRPATIDRIFNMRISTGGVSPSSLYYAIGIGEQASVEDEPRYRLEIYPTPGTTVADAMFGAYDRVARRLTSDDALPDIPALWHPALKMAVRAQAKFQQFDVAEDDWQLASAALDKLILIDGRNQPSLGQSLGAVGMMRVGSETYHFRGTIIQP